MLSLERYDAIADTVKHFIEGSQLARFRYLLGLLNVSVSGCNRQVEGEDGPKQEAFCMTVVVNVKHSRLSIRRRLEVQKPKRKYFTRRTRGAPARYAAVCALFPVRTSGVTCNPAIRGHLGSGQRNLAQ